MLGRYSGRSSPSDFQQIKKLEDEVYLKIMKDISETQQSVFQELEIKRLNEIASKDEVIRAKEALICEMKRELITMKTTLDVKTRELKNIQTQESSEWTETDKGEVEDWQVLSSSEDNEENGAKVKPKIETKIRKRAHALTIAQTDNDVISDLISENEALTVQVRHIYICMLSICMVCI